MHQAYMAGQWLMSHPDNTDFHNPEGCITGEYTDESDTDERMWAYAELMRTDHDIIQDRDRSLMAAAAQKESRQDKYTEHFIEELNKYTERSLRMRTAGVLTTASDGRMYRCLLQWQ